jgi:hypothetical protein
MSRTPEQMELVLCAFQDVAYTTLHRVMPLASCIGATRITIDVLRRFGVTARACPVTLRVCNFDPVHPETVPADKRSMYAIGAGSTLPPMHKRGGWDGHLVAIVENQWLVDASFKQVDHPEIGIHVEEPILLAPIPPWFIDERRGPLVGQTPDTGCWLIYEQDPKNRGFERGGDWRGNHLRPVIETIVRDMRAEIAKAEASS